MSCISAILPSWLPKMFSPAGPLSRAMHETIGRQVNPWPSQELARSANAAWAERLPVLQDRMTFLSLGISSMRLSTSRHSMLRAPGIEPTANCAASRVSMNTTRSKTSSKAAAAQ